jgi:hypothetical protein
MITVVINNPYINGGCRTGYAMWVIKGHVSESVGAGVILPDWTAEVRDDNEVFITDDGTQVVHAELQVVHGIIEGVFIPPTYRKTHEYQWWGLNPGTCADVLKACKVRCEDDYPKPSVADDKSGDDLQLRQKITRDYNDDVDNNG